MVRKNTPKKSSLLAKYTLQYKKKPKSRVFAPLAETYRKLGMYDESLKILRDGMKFHPAYTMGYIVLSHVYYDLQNYELAYNTIRPFVTDNLENITLQKLFAKICINLGYLEEALQTFKYLLLINPRDQYVSEQVKLLEDDLLVKEEQVEENNFVEKRMSNFDINEDDWVQVDFGKGRRDSDQDEGEEWSVQKNETPLDQFKKDLNEDNLEVKETDLDDNYFLEDYDNEEDNTKNESVASDPIITHTLVELYCKQGHYDKALEILNSILELHPDDIPTLNRAEEIKALMQTGAVGKAAAEPLQVLDLEELPNKQLNKDEVVSEEDEEAEESAGYDELLQMVEDKKQKDKELLHVVKERLEQFAQAIRIEAARKQLNL